MEYSQAVPVPSAISVSMLALWWRRAFQAPTKNGRPGTASTARVITPTASQAAWLQVPGCTVMLPPSRPHSIRGAPTPRP